MIQKGRMQIFVSKPDLSYTSGLEGALKAAEMPQNSHSPVPSLSTAPYQQSTAWGKHPKVPLQRELVQKQFCCLVTSLPSFPLRPDTGAAGHPLYLQVSCL